MKGVDVVELVVGVLILITSLSGLLDGLVRRAGWWQLQVVLYGIFFLLGVSLILGWIKNRE